MQNEYVLYANKFICQKVKVNEQKNLDKMTNMNQDEESMNRMKWTKSQK